MRRWVCRRRGVPGWAAGLLLAAGLVLPVATTAAGAQQQALSPARRYLLKFNHVLTPQDPYHAAFLGWAAAVSARTDGNLVIEVYANSQLGVEEDILERIRQGASVGQNTDAARLGNYVRAIACMNAPYFVDSLDEVEKLNDLPLVAEWKEQLARTQGFKVLSFFWVQGFRHFVTRTPIRRPEDLAGMRIRTPPAPIWEESIRALGATPVAMSYGDMYEAIRSGAIDGAELSATAAFTTRMYEVAKYLSETRHILLVNFEVISSKWFGSLPAAYQKILEEECNRAGLEVSRRYLETLDVESMAKLRARGMSVIPASGIDLAAFRVAGEAAYRRLNLDTVRDRIYEGLGRK